MNKHETLENLETLENHEKIEHETPNEKMLRFYKHVRKITEKSSSGESFKDICAKLHHRIIRDLESVVISCAEHHREEANILVYPIFAKINEFYVYELLFGTEKTKQLFKNNEIKPIFETIKEKIYPFALVHKIYRLNNKEMDIYSKFDDIKKGSPKFPSEINVLGSSNVSSDTHEIEDFDNPENYTLFKSHEYVGCLIITWDSERVDDEY